jgi:6-pyruvoyltetrahydropterin/6-carboxytetrahydropterin synthase
MNAKRATIQRTYEFEAAHRLPCVPDGHKCKTMHGHSYRIRVQLTGAVMPDGPEKGMVVDFGLLDAAANALCRKVDHSTLNETLHENPTVENMAPLVWGWFFNAICPALGTMLYCDTAPPSTPGRWSLKVWLEEGPRSAAVWPPEE